MIVRNTFSEVFRKKIPDIFFNQNKEIMKKESLKMMDLASETVVEIIYFLYPAEAATYGVSCKAARTLVNDHHLWNFYGTKILANIQSPIRTQEYVQEAILLLQFPTSKSLYLCMQSAKRSLIGWYMIVPSQEENSSSGNNNQSCGGLVCIQLNTFHGQRVVTLEVIEASGECISTMKIRYSNDHKKLICYLDDEDDGLFSFEFGPRGEIELQCLPDKNEMSYNNNDKSNYFLQPLPQNFQRSKRKDSDYSSNRNEVLNDIGRIAGLFTAPYGSHGNELLHISLTENEGRISEDNSDVNDDEPYYVVDGLKVTGDPNVPAAQLSFTVDVTNSREFYSWIVSDRRPIIFFSNNGVVDATLMSERQTNIRAAYRGKGQINRLPDVWDPEWVDLTLVIYNDPTTSNGATFSIVWDDIGEPYRHLMDFLPFCGRQYPSIDPPLSWSSTNFHEFNSDRFKTDTSINI
jgi:hypothetical protein